MTEDRAISQRNSRREGVIARVSRRDDLGRLTPRSYSTDAWRRFDRERRRGYLAQIAGPPSNEQFGLIDDMVKFEWVALKGEAATDSIMAVRVGLDARRALVRVRAEFNRTLRSPPPAEKPRPYRDYVAQRDTVP